MGGRSLPDAILRKNVWRAAALESGTEHAHARSVPLARIVYTVFEPVSVRLWEKRPCGSVRIAGSRGGTY